MSYERSPSPLEENSLRYEAGPFVVVQVLTAMARRNNPLLLGLELATCWERWPAGVSAMDADVVQGEIAALKLLVSNQLEIIARLERGGQKHQARQERDILYAALNRLDLLGVTSAERSGH